MFPKNLLRRIYFTIAYHLYAKHKITKTDVVRSFGFTLVVPPGVFHPNLYFSSKLLGEHVASLDLENLNVLDIGCGSGVLSLVAASKGACVTSVDINPQAVVATIENAKRNGLTDSITTYEGNLFEPITSGLKFDYILLNPPFYLGEAKSMSELAWKGGSDYFFMSEFSKHSPAFLKVSGKILMVLSSYMNIPHVLNFFTAQQFHLQQVRKRRTPFEQLSVYEASLSY